MLYCCASCLYFRYILFICIIYIAFNLPPKTDEEIKTLLFSQIETEGKERLFYSNDKRKIIYITK